MGAHCFANGPKHGGSDGLLQDRQRQLEQLGGLGGGQPPGPPPAPPDAAVEAHAVRTAAGPAAAVREHALAVVRVDRG
jgi:hypothetical protein